MKKYIFLWLLLWAVSVNMAACSDDGEISGPLTLQTALLKEIGYTTAVCGGNVNGGRGIGSRGICWSTASRPTLEDPHTVDGCGRGEFRSEMTNLTEGTQYYVRAYAETDEGIQYGDEKTCVTLAHGRPTMLMMGVSNIGESGAEVQAEVFTDGGVQIEERGAVYRLKSAGEEEPDLENAMKLEADGTTGLLKVCLAELVDGETYVCRTYVVYADGIIYSSSETFTTRKYADPRIEIEEIAAVSATSFAVSVKAASGTPLPVLEYGVVWGTKSLPTVEDAKQELGEGDGEVNAEIHGLEESTVYHVRPYAVNKNGTVYGEERWVTTLGNKASVATCMTAYITAHRACAGGRIVNFGTMNAPVAEAGLCWNTAPHPTVTDHRLKAGHIDPGHMAFDSLTLFPLKPETKYYVRAYVINEYGTNYGDEHSFTTREPVANYFKAEGSKKDNPVFNGLNLTSVYPGGLASADQQDAYRQLEHIMTAYGSRTLMAYRIYLLPDSAGTSRYIYTTIQYRNSAGKDFAAVWRGKLDLDNDYVYTVSHHQMFPGNNNAQNILDSAQKNGQEEDLLRNMDYLVRSPFVLDWDNERSTTFNSAFYIIPLNDPDKFKRMGVFRYESLLPQTDWW